MSKEKPILFSAPMIKAILSGSKSMTRRILNPQPPEGYSFLGFYGPHCTAVFTRRPSGIEDEAVRLPYAPGTALWVREAHAIVGNVDPGFVLYRANGYEAECERHGFDKPYPPESEVRWRPSIHMPRWASRVTLRVTAVKVERLQDISEEDARAEAPPEPQRRKTRHEIALSRTSNIGDGYRDDFRELWRTIHGPGSWDANPWVAAYGFERVEPSPRPRAS